MQEAIDALYAQDKKFKGHLVLSIDSCKTLLMIRVLVEWEIVEEGFWIPGHPNHSIKDAIVRPDKVLDRDSFFWSWCLGYYVLAPGGDHSNRRLWVLHRAVGNAHEKQKIKLFGTNKAWEAFRKARWNAETLLRSA